MLSYNTSVQNGILMKRRKGACEAQVSFVKILRILSEIHSNFIQYTPPYTMTDKMWSNLHKNYQEKDWINKPTIFAEFAIKYFPK